MCIWRVVEGDRMCEYCSYYGGCEKREKVIPIEERGDRYVEVMNGIVGMDILDRCRLRPVVWARNMVFYQLVKDGYSQGQIGNLMGFDHSSVFHGKKQVENMLEMPGMYPEEIGMWQKFQKTIGIC